MKDWGSVKDEACRHSICTTVKRCSKSWQNVLTGDWRPIGAAGSESQLLRRVTRLYLLRAGHQPEDRRDGSGPADSRAKS
jgi:hypothetical protein